MTNMIREFMITIYDDHFMLVQYMTDQDYLSPLLISVYEESDISNAQFF